MLVHVDRPSSSNVLITKFKSTFQIFLNLLMTMFLTYVLEQNYKTTLLEIVSLDRFYKHL